MSRILKPAEYKEENPFVLKNRLQNALIQEKKEASVDKGKLSKLKFEEDTADRLLEEALAKAKDIIAKARDEAEEIILEAENQKKDIQKKAFDSGYQNGYKKGLKIGEKEGLSRWKNSLEQFNMLRKDLYEQNKAFKGYLEKESVKLSLLIAEKVLGEKIKNDKKTFLKLIRNALNAVAKENDVVIRVSETDYEEIYKQNLKIKGVKNKVSLVKDPTLDVGDCIIEGNSFKLDAGIRTQLKYIESTLKELDVISNE